MAENVKTKSLGKVGQAALRPGEEPLVVVRAMRPGSLKAGAAVAGIGGILGRAVAVNLEKGATAAGIVEIPKMVLALTADRLLVFSQSSMTGKAKELKYEMPVADFVGAEASDGKTLGVKMTPVAFQLTDDTAFAVDVPFIDRAEGKRLAEVLNELVARR